MTELFFKYKTIIISSVSVIICGILIFIFFKTTDDVQYAEPIEVDNTVLAEESTEQTEIIDAYIYVEIKGAVKHPDVYKMPSDARVKDIILKGQLLDNADLKYVNQSEKLRDEMSVYIPTVGEEVEIELKEEKTESIVNINTASKEELMTLNGIGEKKAEAIIQYREDNGLFNKKEDLMNIPGIGQKTFENLEPFIEI